MYAEMSRCRLQPKLSFLLSPNARLAESKSTPLGEAMKTGARPMRDVVRVGVAFD